MIGNREKRGTVEEGSVGSGFVWQAIDILRNLRVFLLFW